MQTIDVPLSVTLSLPTFEKHDLPSKLKTQVSKGSLTVLVSPLHQCRDNKVVNLLHVYQNTTRLIKRVLHQILTHLITTHTQAAACQEGQRNKESWCRRGRVGEVVEWWGGVGWVGGESAPVFWTDASVRFMFPVPEW